MRHPFLDQDHMKMFYPASEFTLLFLWAFSRIWKRTEPYSNNLIAVPWHSHSLRALCSTEGNARNRWSRSDRLLFFIGSLNKSSSARDKQRLYKILGSWDPVFLLDFYQYTNPKSLREPLPALHAWKLTSEADTVGPFQSGSYFLGLFILFQNATSNISPQMICWNEINGSCLEIPRSQNGWIFFTKCHLCRQKLKTGLSMEWRKASGRSF